MRQRSVVLPQENAFHSPPGMLSWTHCWRVSKLDTVDCCVVLQIKMRSNRIKIFLSLSRLDHLIETWQWWSGYHAGFGSHWIELGIEIVPVLLFGVTSIVGIAAVVLEWWLREQNWSTSSKLVVLALLGIGLVYEMIVSFTVPSSSMAWHLGHMFVTHLLLSMLPPILVWLTCPDIDLFTFPFFKEKLL